MPSASAVALTNNTIAPEGSGAISMEIFRGMLSLIMVPVTVDTSNFNITGASVDGGILDYRTMKSGIGF